MLNIITNNYSSVNGPSKVVQNLIKGLEKIKYPYVINHSINSTKRCYIPNMTQALPYIKRKGTHYIVGPNLYVLPRDIPFWYKKYLNNCIYLHPCIWACNLWKRIGFNSSDLRVWPTGIDTYTINEKPLEKDKSILIYFKEREKSGLEEIEKTLIEKNIKYSKIVYGFYKEETFYKKLKDCSFVIWYGSHESQGIALQEVLAHNIPILLFDAKNLGEIVITPRSYIFPKELLTYPVTTAPYFDERCGLKINNNYSISENIDFMYENFNQFKPREYILENLSLEKQAIDLIMFYEKWDMDIETGYNEKLISNNKFKHSISIDIKEKIYRKLNKVKYRLNMSL